MRSVILVPKADLNKPNGYPSGWEVAHEAAAELMKPSFLPLVLDVIKKVGVTHDGLFDHTAYENYKPRIKFDRVYWIMPPDQSGGFDDNWKEINEKVRDENTRLYSLYLLQDARGEYVGYA